MADSKGAPRQYYTPKEVATHNTATDCWVIVLGRVFNVTEVLQKYKDYLTKPLLEHAGEDISYWFNNDTGDVRTCVHPDSMLEVPFLPHGRFSHVPPSDPVSDFPMDFETPWWNDDKYCVGHVTKKMRRIRVLNMLTKQEHLLEVAEEETLDDILNRYLPYNGHAGSYTWKHLGKVLEMGKTLLDNGIVDDDPEFEDLGISEDYYIPSTQLYFNDDLTVA